MAHPHAPRPQGFTLIECLIVVAIAAALAAIAMPWYTDYLRRGHRAHARTTLLQAAHWLERAATATGAYPQAKEIPAGILQLEGRHAAAATATAGSLTVPGERYTVTASSPDGRTYTLVATPTANSPQAADACGALALDQAGRRSVRQARLSAEDCWSR